MKGTFVFVVCGAAEHIDTLHFSLRYLQKFSKNEVIVLTDSSRNEIPVVYSNVIDVQTPKEFSHHQASIFLKVGIHRHLPKGKNYCYLDTDVIAISHGVDAIFDQFIAPIRFAADHCTMELFSPQAVNCECLKDKVKSRQILETAFEYYPKKRAIVAAQKERIEHHFSQLESNFILQKFTALRYKMSGNIFRLDKEFRYDKKADVWYDDANVPVSFKADPETLTELIERETGFTYNEEKRLWIDRDGICVWIDACDHLQEQIHAKFDIDVKDRKWQHWNGGVFLFNDKSHGFLDSWFGKTMEIFEDNEWKIRDQGTLIATAWEMGLQDQNVLGKKWNFIADHINPMVAVNTDTDEITDDGFRTAHQPAFVHVYHHFGDTDWDIWNWVVERAEQ